MPVYKWSQTAGSNSGADPTINWAEGQAPSSINDSARAEMAAVAMDRDDKAGAIVTAGSGTAYTVASYSVYTSLALLSGQRISFSPHTPNGAGPVTLNVDGLGAKPLRLSPGVELPAAAMAQGAPQTALYNNSDVAFYLVDYRPAALGTNSVTTSNITAANVTYPKIQNVAASSLLGNPTGSGATVEEITLGTGLGFSGTSVILNAFSSTNTGAVPASGGGTANFLRADGSFAAPLVSGSRVLLNTLNASSSASLSDLTSITSTYDDYEIVLENLIPATNAVGCELQLHISGSFQSTGYATSIVGASGNTPAGSVAASTFIPCSRDAIVNSQPGVCATLKLYGANSPSNWKTVIGNGLSKSNANSNVDIWTVGGLWATSLAVVDGFQVLMSSGNIASGTIKIYGIVK